MGGFFSCKTSLKYYQIMVASRQTNKQTDKQTVQTSSTKWISLN